MNNKVVLALYGLISILLFSCATPPSPSSPAVPRIPSIKLIENKYVAGLITTEQFKFIIENYLENKLITESQANEAMKPIKQAQIQENIQRIQRIAEKDKRLPLNVRKDKYMVALTSYLKQEEYSKALTYFNLLDEINVEVSPSFTYFWGEALLKTNQTEESLIKLYAYVEKVGSSGKYYSQALQLINQTEDN